MPYDSKEDLPDSVKKLPQHAQKIWQSAFNNAHKEYDDEGTAHATAWSAAEKAGYSPAGRDKKESTFNKRSDISFADGPIGDALQMADHINQQDPHRAAAFLSQLGQALSNYSENMDPYILNQQVGDMQKDLWGGVNQDPNSPAVDNGLPPSSDDIQPPPSSEPDNIQNPDENENEGDNPLGQPPSGMYDYQSGQYIPTQSGESGNSWYDIPTQDESEDNNSYLYDPRQQGINYFKNR